MLIYDIEIKKAIPDKIKPNIRGVEYCEGWHDHANMGLTVIGVYDYESEQYRVFGEDNLEEAHRLFAARKIIVGFNNIAFDNKVLAYYGFNETKLTRKSYDILREIRIGNGLTAERLEKEKKDTTYSLNSLAKVNFFLEKSGTGALAPINWQQKKYATVIDYCLNDVFLTKRLLDQIIKYGFLFTTKQQFIKFSRRFFTSQNISYHKLP
jgi:hypothetical protein